jgi:hypothetical protein
MGIVIFLVCWFILSVVFSFIMGPILKRRSEEIEYGELGRFSEGNQSDEGESN